MRSVTIRCDRCEREVDAIEVAIIKLGQSGALALKIGRDELDLCPACLGQLKDWLTRARGHAPIGFTWRPRPCPHGVPCADPEGCSGEELVPA